jgi:hypothetical protein
VARRVGVHAVHTMPCEQRGGPMCRTGGRAAQAGGMLYCAGGAVGGTW